MRENRWLHSAFIFLFINTLAMGMLWLPAQPVSAETGEDLSKPFTTSSVPPVNETELIVIEGFQVTENNKGETEVTGAVVNNSTRILKLGRLRLTFYYRRLLIKQEYVDVKDLNPFGRYPFKIVTKGSYNPVEPKLIKVELID